MPDPDDPLDALRIIGRDLARCRRERSARFVPAAACALAIIGATVGLVGARPDLLDQPPAQLALVGGLFIVCVLVFPAIGIGLLFPSRAVRIGLVVTAVVGTLFAITGWPLGSTTDMGDHVRDAGGLGGCIGVALASGIGVLGIGFLSGAFLQRRCNTAVYWIASGLALMALHVTTVHCPQTVLLHVLPGHFGAAIVVLLLASTLGLLVRRGHACPPSRDPRDGGSH